MSLRHDETTETTERISIEYVCGGGGGCGETAVGLLQLATILTPI